MNGQHFGPSRSRLSNSKLFEGYEFLCLCKLGNELISLIEFHELLTKNGATLVKKAKDFSENSKRIVLFDEKLQKINAIAADFMFKTAKIQCVTMSWFFDSLASYSIKEITAYV